MEATARDITGNSRGRDMAVRVLTRLGRTEGTLLEYTAKSLNDAELAAALTERGWTWADVTKCET